MITALIKNVFNSSISNPRQLQNKAEKQVTDEMLNESIDIITSVEESGSTRVYIHSTSLDVQCILYILWQRIILVRM